jgi:CIC family chloride channel protein
MPIIKRFLILPITVGVASGLLVSLFMFLIEEIHRHTVERYESILLLPVGLGTLILISELIAHRISPETKGMSADTVIRAYHGKVKLSLLSSVVKMFSSAISIGAGGTAGRLAPSALIGAGIADSLSGLLKLNSVDRRIAIAIGFGAGLSAILKAPLAGAIMSSEIFFKRDFEAQALLPSFVASVVSYSIYGFFYGYSPLFHTQLIPFSEREIHHLYVFIGLGFFSAFCVWAFIRVFNFIKGVFERNSLPPFVKASVGGSISGVMGIISPVAVGGGLVWIQHFLEGRGINYTFLLLSLIAVALGVSFLVGSGASGGVFGPSMVIGAILGALYGLLLKDFNIDIDINSLIIVGMASFLAGVVNAPLSNLILISEITGGYELLVPSMVSVFTSYILTSKLSIFPSQLGTRYDSGSYIKELGLYRLEKLKVKDFMKEAIHISPDAYVQQAREIMLKHGIGGLPVVNRDILVGIITKEDSFKLRRDELSRKKVYEVMSRDVITITPENSLSQALRLMLEKGVGRLPVVDKEGSRKLVGIITREDIGRAIRKEL